MGRMARLPTRRKRQQFLVRKTPVQPHSRRSPPLQVPQRVRLRHAARRAEIRLVAFASSVHQLEARLIRSSSLSVPAWSGCSTSTLRIVTLITALVSSKRERIALCLILIRRRMVGLRGLMRGRGSLLRRLRGMRGRTLRRFISLLGLLLYLLLNQLCDFSCNSYVSAGA